MSPPCDFKMEHTCDPDAAIYAPHTGWCTTHQLGWQARAAFHALSPVTHDWGIYLVIQ
jgi:hypothetical protein